MKVLIACEFSGVVREAFRKQGHDAWSCDILPAEDGSKYHIQDDILNHLDEGWELMIAHPPCTYLTVTANKWNKESLDTMHERRDMVEEAKVFFMKLVNANIPRIAVENPVGLISTSYRKPDQIIQPFEFGHKEPKKTCLWLKGLPKLEPTKMVEPEYFKTKSGKNMAQWFYLSKLKGEERAKMRSVTFLGIADAMAEQWTNPLQTTLV